MSENKENPTLGLVKRWVKAFNFIFKTLRGKPRVSNAELVDSILAGEPAPSTPAQKSLAEQKRKLFMELCEDVDTFHRKKAEAERADNLDQWFSGQVRDFATSTIPDADEEDIKDVEKMVDEAFDDDIRIHSDGLRDEFEDDNEPSKM